MHNHTLRLVDDSKMLVFIDDIKFDFTVRLNVKGFRLGQSEFHLISFLQFKTTLFAQNSVYKNTVAFNDGLDI